MPVLEANPLRRRETPRSATRNRPTDDDSDDTRRLAEARRRVWHLLAGRMPRRGWDDDVDSRPYDDMDEQEEAEALRDLSMKALADEWDDDSV